MPHMLQDKISGCIIAIDPLDKFKDLPPEHLYECCGLLTSIFCTSEGETFKERGENGYQFGTNWSKCGEPGNASITKDGVYSYPEDPDLYPIAEFTKNDDNVWIYQYGMVVVPDPDRKGMFLTCRMD